MLHRNQIVIRSDKHTNKRYTPKENFHGRLFSYAARRRLHDCHGYCDAASNGTVPGLQGAANLIHVVEFVQMDLSNDLILPQGLELDLELMERAR